MNIFQSAFHKMKRKAITDREDQQYIRYVCEKTGWSYDKAKGEMDKAKQDGISYKYFAKRKIWTRSESQMIRAKKNIQLVEERNKADREYAIEQVCKATGWSPREARDKIKEARINCGSSFKDYYKFKLYERTPEEQREYLTLRVAEKLAFQYNNNAEETKVLLYKGRFAKKYSDLFHRVWFINRNLSYEEFLKKIDGVEDLICKPTSSTQGKGIVKIHCGSDVADKRAVYDQIMSMKKRMICEECIIQHPAIAAFNHSSVNTIRVLTIVYEGRCHHVYAGFRMGCGDIVDNFHAGGIIATVDIQTGVTCMDAIDLEGRHYPLHPKSNLPTLGFQIPCWDQILSLTQEAALRLNGVGMVGWDVAVTEKGPCLIEGNSEASYHIIQLPYVESGIGMKKLFAPYLNE